MVGIAITARDQPRRVLRRSRFLPMDIQQVVPIDQAQDERLAAYANLRHAGTRRSGEHFIVEGRLLVKRLIASNYPVASILVERGHEPEFTSQIDGGPPIYSLPREQLQQLVGFDFHRGVMACGYRLPLNSIDSFRFSERDVPVALAVIGVTELENLGSMIRSAAGFGIRHILIGPKTIDPFSRRVIRVSMGNVFGLQLYDLDQPIAQLTRIRQQMKMRTIATTLDQAATPLHQFARDDRGMVLIVGNEAEGLDRRVLQTSSDQLTIPMHLGTDSLNVAVAAAVFMHGLQKGVSLHKGVRPL